MSANYYYEAQTANAPNPTAFSWAKALFGALALGAFLLWGSALADARPNVLDIAELRDLGLSPTTIEELIVVSLKPRARPPLDADFIVAMAQYGGNDLTGAYLRLDDLTGHLEASPLGRDEIMKLIRAKVARDEIIRMINDAAQRVEEDGPAGRAVASPPAAGSPDSASSSSAAPLALAAGGGLAAGAYLGSSGASKTGIQESELAPAADSVPSLPETSVPSLEVPSAPAGASLSPATAGEEMGTLPSSGAATEFASSDGGTLALERAGERFASGAPTPRQSLLTPPAAPSGEREAFRRTPQELSRGEQADPARPLPREGGAYPVRTPSADSSFFMGSYETVTPDGRRVDVHRNAASGVLGTSVESSPSGHKVHRAFSGRVERYYPDARDKAPEGGAGGADGVTP
ncbi:MAG: hypothetical protein LBO66_10850 [Deltaproteobacteria bacterium]|jgi:hypothetical protein|nr:hypothetical protein [Deltaproteobacteria bacterium]